ncbi:ECF-type sigma factor [Roseateles paludis]|jgi:RNA polymerase sigma factor (TIGR02999 family)|uniref:ECF-type sigma factor n=1 Tax=Roseateles paludis TaxID=3145238 RepID=A0ABV0FXW1_9BURK
MPATPAITELLAGMARGDAASLQQLYAQLYPEIKRVARMRLAQSGHAAGLNTTALVHEGFLRIAEQQGLQGESRGQFFVYVGRVLRSVVIDQLRAEGRDKRGGDAVVVTLSAAGEVAAAQSEAVDLIGLDQALSRMRELDAGLYELIEMVSFAGLTIAEIAVLRGVATRTVNRDLLKARGLLRELLGE